jgi:hypothetical protein
VKYLESKLFDLLLLLWGPAGMDIMCNRYKDIRIIISILFEKSVINLKVVILKQNCKKYYPYKMVTK